MILESRFFKPVYYCIILFAAIGGAVFFFAYGEVAFWLLSAYRQGTV